MDFLGVIQAKSDSAGIDKSAWLALIERRRDLLAPEPVTCVNPFTRKHATAYPPKTAVRLFIDGKLIGSFGWAENDENVVIVYGDLDPVRPVAAELAAELGGEFLTADQLT